MAKSTSKSKPKKEATETTQSGASKENAEELKAKVKEQLKRKAGGEDDDDELKEDDFEKVEHAPSADAGFTFPWNKRMAKPHDVSMFFRELSILIESGYPLLRALTLLANKTSNRHLAREIDRIASEVERGSALAKAMASSPWYFDAMIVSMIEAGETGGNLPEVLVNIAEDFESTDELAERVKQAMAYPLLTAAVALAVLLLVLVFVVPTFDSVYQRHEMDLPGPTAMMVALSHFVTGYWWLWIPLLILVVWYARKRLVQNINAFDGLVIKTPLLGDIVVLGAMARFASSMHVLVSNGVPILQSLDLAKGSVRNTEIKKLIQRMHDNVERGKSLAQPLAEAGYIPPLMVDMMYVGEESGKLPFVLSKVVDALKLQLERIISMLSLVLGPVMTLIVGVLVLFITLSLFIPYFHFLATLSATPFTQ